MPKCTALNSGEDLIFPRRCSNPCKQQVSIIVNLVVFDVRLMNSALLAGNSYFVRDSSCIVTESLVEEDDCV